MNPLAAELFIRKYREWVKAGKPKGEKSDKQKSWRDQ